MLHIAAKWLFILASALVVWGWFLYPLVLAVLSVGRRKRPLYDQAVRPCVSVIITAHNEETVIAKRVENCLQQNYPPDRLEIIVASDHSTDRTDEIVRSFRNPRVRLVPSPGRGKSAAQNEAIAEAKGEIIVFTDADPSFAPDAVAQLALPFSDAKVGCVAGHIIWGSPDASILQESRDLYWRYEFFLWKLESLLGIMAWAGGLCMAVRKSIFVPLEAHFGEDSVVPLDVAARGYRVVYQPEAVAYEDYIGERQAASAARIRMTVRSFRGTLSRSGLLNPFRYPGLALSIVSHKLIRWVTGYLLLTALLCNLALLGSGFFKVLVGIQLGFYITALLGSLLAQRNRRIPVISAAYSFCLMQWAMSVGVARAILGRRIVAYQSVG
jgi:cellulose synthase/poly-beta-1,6-N-acetylglucosamine synthase-like glycosyltransferase